jgi:molecular chaperone DnaK
MDREIARRLVSSSAGIRKAVESVAEGFSLLVEQVEEAKVQFLQGDDSEGEKFIPGFPEKIFLPRDLVCNVAEEFAEEARASIKQVLETVGIPADDVTKVLFAGGVSQAPRIRQRLMGLFPEAEVIVKRPQLSTARGCAELAKHSFSVELAADFGVRQSDDTICILLPRGQTVEANRYREAEFEVTDVFATEALFDFGIGHWEANRRSLWAADSREFRSLHHTFIRVSRSDLPRGSQIPDRVKVFTGLDENLTLAAYLKSARTEASKQEFITGIPLKIRVGGNFG